MAGAIVLFYSLGHIVAEAVAISKLIPPSARWSDERRRHFIAEIDLFFNTRHAQLVNKERGQFGVVTNGTTHVRQLYAGAIFLSRD